MPNPSDVFELLNAEFADAVRDAIADGLHPSITVAAERWHDVALFLRDDGRLGFDWLRCISGVDHVEDKRLTAVYHLHATQRPANPLGMWALRHEIAVKIHVDRDHPQVPSVADVWPAANWHEREAFDLLGIVFEGHPDLRRILCCEDWVGHPLRKDYEFPLEYHGIPGTTEYAQTRSMH